MKDINTMLTEQLKLLIEDTGNNRIKSFNMEKKPNDDVEITILISGDRGPEIDKEDSQVNASSLIMEGNNPNKEIKGVVDIFLGHITDSVKDDPVLLAAISSGDEVNFDTLTDEVKEIVLNKTFEDCEEYEENAVKEILNCSDLPGVCLPMPAK